MKVLLDTNIIIEFWKLREPVTTAVHTLAASGLYISQVTEAELLLGALNKRDLAKIRRDLANLTIYSLTSNSGRLMSQLVGLYGLSHRLSIPDALIAATALHYGLPLYTLNLKDFRYIAGLNLYVP